MNPWIVRNLLFPLHERLIGRATMRYWKELEDSQWLSVEQLRELQQKKLRSLLCLAWDNCPGHRHRLQDAGCDRHDLASFAIDEISRLPILSKAEIRQDLKQLVNWDCKGGVFRYTTGGSTGEPLIFYFGRRRQAYDQAARMRTHQWFGVRPGEREVYLWGAPVELNAQDRMKTLRDRLTNQLLLSAFEMSPETMSGYIKRIGKFKPACLFGYPSSLAMLAEFYLKSNRVPAIRGMKAVFATGEVLFPHQRSVIEKAFGVPVANGYGSRDAGFIAHECASGAMHITAENMIAEVVAPDGVLLPDGAQGELVVTHLDNHALPFIRYRTGDSARLIDGPCECGRALPLLELCEGRTTDQLMRADGTAVHALALIYTMRDLQGVQQFKIVQKALDRVAVMVVKDGSYDNNCELRIQQEFQSRLGSGVEVDIEYQQSIPVDRSGKYRYVTCEIERESVGMAH